MPHYLFQGSYEPEALKAVMRNPQQRVEIARKTAEKLGGKLEGLWFCFGEYDVVSITQFPDNVPAAALCAAVASGGAFRAGRTTVLISTAEFQEAGKRAEACGYKPPSA